MMGTTHLIGGFAAGCAAAEFCPSIPTKATMITLGTLGGIVPDIDHKGSKIAHVLPVLSWIVRLFSDHRGLFHCPLLYVVLYGLIQLLQIQNDLAITAINGLFLGILSHLFLDACNAKGIPLLFPFSRKHFHILKIQTNSFMEMCIRCLLVLVAAFILLWPILPKIFH